MRDLEKYLKPQAQLEDRRVSRFTVAAYKNRACTTLPNSCMSFYFGTQKCKELLGSLLTELSGIISFCVDYLAYRQLALAADYEFGL